MPERIARMAIRIWRAVSAFERLSATACEGNGIDAPYVSWDVPEWVAIKIFLAEHATHMLELVPDEGKPISLFMTLRDLWSQ